IGCVTPWPSTIYEVEAGTDTGMQLDLPVGALPATDDGVAYDPTGIDRKDGFSPAGFAFTAFPVRVDPANLVTWHDYAASLDDASPTVLVDMDSGERVAHFAEVDANAEPGFDDQALYIRPAARLRPGARYAVGIRKSLKAEGGGDLPVPPGFAAVVDGGDGGHQRLARVLPRYDAIFAALADAGVPRDDLVVAWDFTTASQASLTDDLRNARDAALAAMGEGAANLTWDVGSDATYTPDPRFRRILGTYQAPMLLTDTSNQAELNRDGAGLPVVDGTTDAPFVAMIPDCAAAQRPVPVIVFGHGFFGDLDEAQDTYMRLVAEQLCAVVVGTVWKGMSTTDFSGAALALNDASKLYAFGERIIQGIINQVALVQLVHNAMGSDLLADGGGTLIDPDRIYFYGISQGAILGASFFATDPLLTRAVLNVGGGDWSMLFERSTHWQEFGLIIAGAYPGALNSVILQALMQMAFDPTENVHLAGELDPGKQLLLQIAVGDSQVSNLSSEVLARELGIPVLTPSVAQPYGVPAMDGPLPSALTIWDEHPDPLPHESNLLNEVDNGTHGTMRRRAAVVEQIGTFLSTGEVVNTCGDAPCDCATGACGDVQ
ncbi:MAG TPA: hypothetical protein VL172_11810, partial [Kofleriaceae bacterium]|nr:hypothetical protein [Kofleriaceae bacterium]